MTVVVTKPRITMDLRHHAIVAGFGVPGRLAADWLAERGTPYCVVELNPQTVQRCGKSGTPIIAGSVADEATLRAAGIEAASMLIIAVPNDHAVLDAILIAKRLNPTIHIVARCAFTSAGLEATRRGADKVIVAEQVVANELVRLLEERTTATSNSSISH
jgi:CPA2 family monovalent cation:H+ antiporter-2